VCVCVCGGEPSPWTSSVFGRRFSLVFADCPNTFGDRSSITRVFFRFPGLVLPYDVGWPRNSFWRRVVGVTKLRSRGYTLAGRVRVVFPLTVILISDTPNVHRVSKLLRWRYIWKYRGVCYSSLLLTQIERRTLVHIFIYIYSRRWWFSLVARSRNDNYDENVKFRPNHARFSRRMSNNGPPWRVPHPSTGLVRLG